MKLILMIIPIMLTSMLCEKTTETMMLQNGLKVLMVSDPSVRQSGLYLQVMAGSSFEPPNISGIAHLLEHMLHMRSEKYPKEGFYKASLALCKGTSNAMTNDISTNFYFWINDESLECFERMSSIFSRFFIDPILDKENVEREINAVHNEYENDLVINGWRLIELIRDLANEKSVFRHFSIGNFDKLDTKKYDIAKVLKDFFGNHYSAHLMTLVIFSHHEIGHLKNIANLFKEVKNIEKEWKYPNHLSYLKGKRQNTPFEYLPFPKKRRNKLVFYEPIGYMNSLFVVFPIQNSLLKINDKISRPLELLASLLKFKGKQSLFHNLKSKDLISGLTVTLNPKLINLNLLIIRFDLKVKSFQGKLQVVKELFRFINSLKGMNRSVYNKIAFKKYLAETYSKEKTFDMLLMEYVSTFRQFGDFNPRIELFSQNFLKFNRKAFERYVSYFAQPENSLIIMTRQKIQKEGFSKIFRFSGNNPSPHYQMNFDLDALFELRDTIYPEKMPLKLNFEKRETLRMKSPNLKIKGFFYDSTMKFYFISRRTPKSLLQNIRSSLKILPFSLKSSYLPSNLTILSACPHVSLQTYRRFYGNAINLEEFVVEIDRKDLFNRLLYGKEWQISFKSHRVFNKTCRITEKYYDMFNVVQPLIFSPSVRLWFLTDRVMEIPKTVGIFELSLKTRSSKIMFMLLVWLLDQRFSQEISEIQEDWGVVSFNTKGDKLLMKLFGFSDKFLIVLKKVFGMLTATEFSSEELEKAKEMIKETLDLRMKDIKQKLLLMYFEKLFYKGAYLPVELKRMIDGVDLELFNRFLSNFQRKMKLKGLIIGNILEDQVKQIGIFLKKALPKSSKPKLLDKSFSEMRKKSLLSHHGLRYFEISENEHDGNSGILNIYVKKGYTRSELNILNEFVMFFHQKAFNYLRTQKQLGYIVLAKVYSNRDYAGLGILIQGSRHTPSEMDKEIENFLSFFKKLINEPENQHLFERTRKNRRGKTIKREGMKVDYSLMERAESIWWEGLDSDNKEKKVKKERSRKKVDWNAMREFLNNLLFEKRQKISIQIGSPKMKYPGLHKKKVNKLDDLIEMAKNFQRN